MAVAQDKRASELTAPVSIADTDVFAGYRPGTGGEPNLDIRATAGQIRATILARLAAGDVAVGIAADELFPGSAATSLQVRAKLTRHLADYGTVDATGATDMASLLENAGSGSNTVIILPAGTLRCDDATISGSSLRFVGDGDRNTKLTTALGRTVLRFGTGASNLVFDNIHFDSTYAPGTESTSSGLILSNDKSLAHVWFRFCKFTCVTSGANAVKIIAEALGVLVENVHFQFCEFDGIGRMAIEVQNHTDNTVRFRDFSIYRSTFKNTGAGFPAAGSGQAVSFSGYCVNCHTEKCTFDDIAGYGLEYARGGRGCTIAGNRFRNCSRTTNIISVSAGGQTDWHQDYSIYDNKIIDETSAPSSTTDQTGDVLFENLYKSNLWGNNFRISGKTEVRSSEYNKINGDTYNTRGSYALYVSSGSDRNDLRDVTADNSRSTTGLAALRFHGTNTTRNRFFAGRILKGSSGVSFDEASTATANWVSPETFVGNNLPTQGKALAITDANYTLTIADMQMAVLDVTGTLTAGRTLTGPAMGIAKIVRNSTAQTLTIQPSGGSGGTIAAGKVASVSGSSSAWIVITIN